MASRAGAAIYSILTPPSRRCSSAAEATSRLAVGESKLEAVLYGVILWGTLFLGLVWLFSAGIRPGSARPGRTVVGVLYPGRGCRGDRFALLAWPR